MQKKAEKILNITNARYVKNIKNGKQPTVAEIDAHNRVEQNKINKINSGASTPMTMPVATPFNTPVLTTTISSPSSSRRNLISSNLVGTSL